MELTTSIFALVKELDNFSYELSVVDHVWNILFPGKGKMWHHLHEGFELIIVHIIEPDLIIDNMTGRL